MRFTWCAVNGRTTVSVIESFKLIYYVCHETVMVVGSLDDERTCESFERSYYLCISRLQIISQKYGLLCVSPRHYWKCLDRNHGSYPVNMETEPKLTTFSRPFPIRFILEYQYILNNFKKNAIEFIYVYTY